MLDRIIDFSLRSRLFVVIASLGIAVYGAAVALELPIDVLPDLNRPTVTILTDAHGLVPEDVEQLVTLPIERAMSGAAGVQRVRSVSGTGLSVVFVEFGWDTEIYRNRQIVAEKLQMAAPQLPPGIVPQMAPISSVMGQIQLVGVVSRTGALSPSELRARADTEIKLRLLSIPGVAQVVSIGGAPRQLQAIVDAQKLQAYDVTLAEVADAVRRANLNASGGFLHLGARGPLVTVTGLAEGAGDFLQAVVRPDPERPVRIADVAQVDFGPASLRTGSAGIDAGGGVILVVFKQPGVDTRTLTARVDAEVDQLRRSLPDEIEVRTDLYRQADFINRAIDNVLSAVRDGALLVVLILFAFLLNFRTTLITLTAIPMSIAITAICFRIFGLSVNTMTLGGLAVAVGALVDDAIVDVENVFRRLRQQPGRSPLRVVFEASSEVRKPILIGTLVVAAVYLPLFALTGMEGRLFRPIGVAYIVSILASLAVALTLTPVLCFYLLPGAKATQREDGWVVRRLKSGAATLIALSLERPRAIAAAVGSLALLGAFILTTRGSEFLPPFNEGVAQVNLVLPPGTSLETAEEYAHRMEEVVLEVPGVRSIARRTGRAEGDEHAEGLNFSEAIVDWDPESDRSREEALSEIRARIAETFPGVASSVEQPLAHLLSHLLSGVSAQVAIKVSGPDLPVLRRAAREAEVAVRGIPGVTDLYVEPQVLIEQVEVRPRRAALARYGLDVHTLAENVELALEGGEIDRLVLGQYAFPIVVRLEEEDRRDLEALRELRIPTTTGETVRLSEVADVRLGRTPNQIRREHNLRRVVVQHNVQERSLGEVAADVERALEPVRASLPAGYAISVSGQFEAQEAAGRLILGLSLVSLIVMFLLIYAHFGSANLAIQTLAKIPMALIGAVVFVVLTGQTVSIATLVGLVSLGGIAARNTILLMDHYLHLMREEGEAFSREMILRAGRERIVPVTMTALTSGIALIPLVLAPGQPGRELLYPVASVIVGGLISSTLLDVLLTPGLFWLFGKDAAERIIRDETKEQA